MTPLSVIVPCCNEEKVIGDCLASLHFADEILVVDSFSTDRTLDLAWQHTNRILQHQFWSHGAQNNWAIPQAKHDWVLIVDADERVTPELASELGQLLSAPKSDGYWIRRRNFFLGKELRHGSSAADFVLRLFRRDKGRYEEKRVHSQVLLNGSAGRCHGTLLHYSYPGLEDFVRKGQRFTREGALMAFEAGVRSGGLAMLGHAFGRFIKSYLLKRGFLDGTEGLIYACLEADHTFMKYARLWELERSRAGSNGAAAVRRPDA